LCLFSCLFTLIVVFVIYCFVLPIVANKDLYSIYHLVVVAPDPTNIN